MAQIDVTTYTPIILWVLITLYVFSAILLVYILPRIVFSLKKNVKRHAIFIYKINSNLIRLRQMLTYNNAVKKLFNKHIKSFF